MVASVPQLAGYLHALRELLPPTGRVSTVLDGNVPLVQEYTQGCPDASQPTPRSHGLYHVLYQLYAIRPITCLPKPMKDWIEARISWMEEQADPLDLMGLQDTVRQQLWELSLVSKEPRYVL
jgi:hypothetical protein